MDLSIIIIHYNTPELLKRLLESLERDSLLQQTLVVDCGSPTFETQKLQKRFDAPFLPLQTNRGYSYAVNRGMSQSDGNPILLLNADVRIWFYLILVILQYFDYII